MYALIMAGGVGSRFWPKSRSRSPKHLLSIVNERNMLENTILRLDSFIKRSDCFIITNEEQKPNIIKKISRFNEENIISEPMGKNTAAAVGYGALKLSMLDEDATMVVLPADHYIKNTEKFVSLLVNAADFVDRNQDSLVTIGIEATHPETGYGYIQVGKQVKEGVYCVRNFAEKPNMETAIRFISSGDFYWNSGIFVWKAKTILKKIEKHLPELYESLMKIKEALLENKPKAVIERIYKEIKSISIDYGVMEKAENVKVLLGDFGWSDVGSWLEIYRLKEKSKNNNVVEANYVSIDSEGCYITSDNKEKVITTIGLKNMAVIDMDDSLLITPLSRSQDVKELVLKLKARKLNQVL